jgi:hypothetical protein
MPEFLTALTSYLYEIEVLSQDKGIIHMGTTILGIIHHPVFYLKHDVSEIGFCLRTQVELNQLGQVHRHTEECCSLGCYFVWFV